MFSSVSISVVHMFRRPAWKDKQRSVTTRMGHHNEGSLHAWVTTTNGHHTIPPSNAQVAVQWLRKYFWYRRKWATWTWNISGRKGGVTGKKYTILFRVYCPVAKIIAVLPRLLRCYQDYWGVAKISLNYYYWRCCSHSKIIIN